ncbi:MAG: hypothetical protein R3F47_05905 [Gammaproteobacteria bacterium]
MEQSEQNPMPAWSGPVVQHGWSSLKWLVGLLSLALRSGGELAQLAGRMHHTIAQVPPVVDPALLGLAFVGGSSHDPENLCAGAIAADAGRRSTASGDRASAVPGSSASAVAACA